MKNKFFDKLILTGTLIFFFTLLSSPWAWINLGTAQAQTKPTVANFPCTISTVAAAEFVEPTNITEENRIYVSCTNSPGGGLFSFASAVGATAGNANRYLVVLNTALALGKTVTVYYDINSINNPLGCRSDCRKITGLVLGP
jgi:hypothetical protein